MLIPMIFCITLGLLVGSLVGYLVVLAQKKVEKK